MKKIKLIIGIILVFTIGLFNTCYASSVTKEDIGQSVEDFLIFLEEENTDVEINEDTIKFQIDGKDLEVKYNLNEDKAVFESSFDVDTNIQYDEFDEKQSLISESNLVMYAAIANKKGAGFEDATVYYAMTLLENAFKIGIKDEMYVIIDDINVSDGVTINKDKDDKYTIYTSEFGSRVMEYTAAIYDGSESYTDELNTYTLESERRNVTEDSCTIVSKITINLDADFSQIKGAYDDLFGDTDDVPELDDIIDGNINSNENITQNDEVLPEAGIDFNYLTALNIILVIACLGLICMMLTSVCKKKLKD